MIPDSKTHARVAKHGEKMIEVRIRFWTDSMADGKNQVIPKHAWDFGMIAMDSNPTHGIIASAPTPFNSLLELTPVLAKVLQQHGVTLHTGRKLSKLIQE